jgi:thiol-disulfide isomerase/thioredoxin
MFDRVLIAAVLCLAGATLKASADSGLEVAIGAPLQEAMLTGLNGPSRLLSTYRGKPLLINVWASWCGPCKQEMASLERLAWREQSRYFAIIGISTDDEADRALSFLKTSNATISHFIDRGLAMEHMLGATRLPLTVLVDAHGRILEKVYGAREWDAPEALRLIDRTLRKN